MPFCLIAQKAPGITTSSFSGNTTWALIIVAITYFHMVLTKHVFSISNLTSDLSLFIFALRELKMQCNAMQCLASNQVHTLSLLANITNQVSRCKTSILFPTLGTTGSISTCIGTPCRRLAGFHSVKKNNDDMVAFSRGIFRFFFFHKQSRLYTDISTE